MPPALPPQQQIADQPPESSRAVHSGAIFLCDPRTETECLQRGLFGLPTTQSAIVRAIVPEATLLFLFNVRMRQMIGVFRAASWPQQNLDPSAWGRDPGGGSRFPLQVRVCIDSPAVLVLSEERLRHVLDYHGTHNRFDLQLNEEAAANVARLICQHGEPRLAHAGPSRPPPAAGLHASEGGWAPQAAEWVLAMQGGDRSRRNGLVFICDPTTENECLSRRLLGLPKSQTSLLSKLGESSLLFLFNVRSRRMLGIFKPNGAAGMEIEPNAFGGGGRFPVQVRFVPIHPSGQVLSVPEAALSEVLRYRNGSTRFDLLLRGRAVDKMVGIFAEQGAPAPIPPPLPLPPLPPADAPQPMPTQSTSQQQQQQQQQQGHSMPPLPTSEPWQTRTGTDVAAVQHGANGMPPLPPVDTSPVQTCAGTSDSVSAPGAVEPLTVAVGQLSVNLSSQPRAQ